MVCHQLTSAAPLPMEVMGYGQAQGDMSSSAKNAIDALMTVDQTADGSLRSARLQKVMQSLDGSTLQELYELYAKTADVNDEDATFWKRIL
uniref:EF-hand domain-containing protein n=1 Tax=Panagrellus redivivus TaxID=6233 RepID=A0A7E4ZQ25_PANRE